MPPPRKTPTSINLTGEKQAISVSVKSFAAGLSGKLVSGDIVSIVAPDYKKQGVTVIPPELQYVEVIAVTAGSGYDANQRNIKSNSSTEQEDAEEKELPCHRYAAGDTGAEQNPRRCWRRTVRSMCPWSTGAARKMRRSLPRRRMRCFPSCTRMNQPMKRTILQESEDQPASRKRLSEPPAESGAA
jgi:hypothetical protein